MKLLTEYLQKFRVVLGDKTREKGVIQQTLKDVCNISIPTKSIEVRGGVASCNLSPIERSELSIQKRNVLAALERRGVLLTDLR